MPAPRESLAMRLKVMLAQPGRTVSVVNATTLTVHCEDEWANGELQRQFAHAMAILRNTTGRLVDVAPYHWRIEL